MNLIIGIIMLLQVCPVHCHAANRLLYENFDSGTLDPRLTVFDKHWESLSPPKYKLIAGGRNGMGNCFSSGSVSEAYLCWMKDIPNPWPTDEFYVSYWMRYPKYVRTNPTNENLKLFYPHWDGTKSYVHYSMTQPDTVYYSAMAQGTMVAYSRWLKCPRMTDGKWHRYEFYVCFSKGVSKFAYDGSVKVSDTYGPGKWTNRMYYISAPSIDALDPSVFAREVDDLEIWDGKPVARPPGQRRSTESSPEDS